VEDGEQQFSAFVRAQSRQLRRTAWLLTGDWSSADDLVQSALLKTWRRWSAVQLADPAPFVRRVLVTTFLTQRRRRWSGEVATGWLPEPEARSDASEQLAEREVLVGALRGLPARQRAVVVLRYFNDLSERAVADALGCSIGSVKTHGSRALRALRANEELRATFAVGR
jgi:RNA polymerase sigma-70 factor (sigma-E family)